MSMAGCCRPLLVARYLPYSVDPATKMLIAHAHANAFAHAHANAVAQAHARAFSEQLQRQASAE